MMESRAIRHASQETQPCACECGDMLAARNIGVCANVYHEGTWMRLEWWIEEHYLASNLYGDIGPGPGVLNTMAGTLKPKLCRDCGVQFMGNGWARRCSVCATKAVLVNGARKTRARR